MTSKIIFILRNEFSCFETNKYIPDGYFPIERPYGPDITSRNNPERSSEWIEIDQMGLFGFSLEPMLPMTPVRVDNVAEEPMVNDDGDGFLRS